MLIVTISTCNIIDEEKGDKKEPLPNPLYIFVDEKWGNKITQCSFFVKLWHLKMCFKMAELHVSPCSPRIMCLLILHPSSTAAHPWSEKCWTGHSYEQITYSEGKTFGPTSYITSQEKKWVCRTIGKETLQLQNHWEGNLKPEETP